MYACRASCRVALAVPRSRAQRSGSGAPRAGERRGYTNSRAAAAGNGTVRDHINNRCRRREDRTAREKIYVTTSRGEYGTSRGKYSRVTPISVTAVTPRGPIRYYWGSARSLRQRRGIADTWRYRTRASQTYSSPSQLNLWQTCSKPADAAVPTSRHTACHSTTTPLCHRLLRGSRPTITRAVNYQKTAGEQARQRRLQASPPRPWLRCASGRAGAAMQQHSAWSLSACNGEGQQSSNSSSRGQSSLSAISACGVPASEGRHMRDARRSRAAYS